MIKDNRWKWNFKHATNKKLLSVCIDYNNYIWYTFLSRLGKQSIPSHKANVVITEQLIQYVHRGIDKSLNSGLQSVALFPNGPGNHEWAL